MTVSDIAGNCELLFETLGGLDAEWTVVAVNGRLTPFLPLDVVVDDAGAVQSDIAEMAASPQTRRVRGGRVIEIQPTRVRDQVYGVLYRESPAATALPALPRVASWWIDTTTQETVGSVEYSLAAGLPRDYFEQPGRTFASVHGVMNLAPDEIATHAQVLLGKPGETMQGIFSPQWPDGSTWRTQFSVRFYREHGADGKPSVGARGLVIDAWDSRVKSSLSQVTMGS